MEATPRCAACGGTIDRFETVVVDDAQEKPTTWASLTRLGWTPIIVWHQACAEAQVRD
jgi:hypothetical protein